MNTSRLLTWSLSASVAIALGCESGPVSKPKPAAAPAAPPAAGTVSRHGAELQPGPAVALSALLQNPDAYAGQTVTTEGTVQRACSRKGCWMEIGSGEDACRITFKDYAFFVPTDAAGAHAKVQGRLSTREVEAAAVQHLEEEGARFSNKKADGSATEVQMVATAVELRR